MKRLFLTGILLATLIITASSQQREIFDLDDWVLWGGLNVRHTETGIIVSGTVGRGGAGYVIESRNLGLEKKQHLILAISGITSTDKFDGGKLLKLEINDTAISVTGGSMNRNDPNFLNAKNGEYVFDISSIQNIRKINLVLYNCTIVNVKIELFTE